MLGFVRRAPVLLVAGVLLCAAEVQAAPRVGALLPALRGVSAPELRDKFHDAVSRGIAAAGVEVVSGAEARLRLSSSAELLDCAGPGACAARVATALRTDHTVASEIVIAGKDYTIRLHLLDAAGRAVARNDESCDICTVKEAEEATARAATKLINVARPTLDQPAAVAKVEPPKVETPPPKVEAPPPPKVEAPPPRAEAETPPLASTPAPAVPPEHKRFPYKWVGIASLVAGGVGIIVGAPLVAIDGNPTCSAPAGQDPKTYCKEVYDTAGGGGALLGLGLAGVAAGSVLLILDWKLGHAKKASAVSPVSSVSIGPTREGVWASVGGRF